MIKIHASINKEVPIPGQDYSSPNADQSAKLDSIWFGSGARFKQRAFELAYGYWVGVA